MNVNTISPDLGGNEGPMDSALACLVMLARFHQVAIEPEQIKHEFASNQGMMTEADVLLAAKKSGLKVKALDTHFDRIERTRKFFS